MINHPELIVMLTRNDVTIENACDVFNSCKNANANYWGMKELGLSPKDMCKVYDSMKTHGKSTVLEVVSYNEPDCIKGAKLAAECRCDILMGTVYFDSVHDICHKNSIKYMPFVGDVSGRPTILCGDEDMIIAEAESLAAKGVFGLDLLGYRYSGDYHSLVKRCISQVNIPICVAGSINSTARLEEIRSISPWAYTIGSAFFDSGTKYTLTEKINYVSEFMKYGHFDLNYT